MKLNIGIIDDSIQDIAYLTDFIKAWGAASDVDVNTYSCASADDLSENIEIRKSDIIFVDVMMPGKTGMDVVAEIKLLLERTVLFVLTSSNHSYVYDGYEVEAFDFLRKPADNEQVSRILGRAMQKLFSDNSGVITFEYGKTLYKISCADIYYIYMTGNYANIVAKNNDTYMIRRSMKELSQMLPISFVQVNRNTIVNVCMISTISTTEIRFKGIEKTVVPSRKCMNELVNAFKKCN